jgi:inner membrane protein
MKSLIGMKVASLAVVIMVLMVALNMIQGVVNDRQLHRNRAINSIGSSQVVTGPVIHAACVESWDEKVKEGTEEKLVERRREFAVMALPETLAVKSGADIEPRARGVHRVNAFNMKMQMTATWNRLDGLNVVARRLNARMSCGMPIVMLSVTDPNGIRSASLKVDGQSRNLKSGTFHPKYSRGVHSVLPDSIRQKTEPLTIDFDLEIFGTESLSIVPVAETTQVRMQSNWRHPSFGGNFLPADRSVSAQGFDATWRVSSLATGVADGLRQHFDTCAAEADGAADKGANCLETIKVSFIDPVNPYSLSDRATKYGVLFIVLTFAAVGLFEVMERLRVHPVQYFLVGSAISIFFLLLVSLSEHIAFNWAYLAAASACVLLLGYYACHMLRGLWRGLPFGFGVAMLYGLLFVLLQLEQTALVVGAVALFMVLAAVMYFTRQVDWYRLTSPDAAS